jgi:hypothetical protein
METIGKVQRCNADQITGSYLSLAKGLSGLSINRLFTNQAHPYDRRSDEN